MLRWSFADSFTVRLLVRLSISIAAERVHSASRLQLRRLATGGRVVALLWPHPIPQGPLPGVLLHPREVSFHVTCICWMNRLTRIKLPPGLVPAALALQHGSWTDHARPTPTMEAVPRTEGLAGAPRPGTRVLELHTPPIQAASTLSPQGPGHLPGALPTPAVAPRPGPREHPRRTPAVTPTKATTHQPLEGTTLLQHQLLTAAPLPLVPRRPPPADGRTARRLPAASTRLLLARSRTTHRHLQLVVRTMRPHRRWGRARLRLLVRAWRTMDRGMRMGRPVLDHPVVFESVSVKTVTY